MTREQLVELSRHRRQMQTVSGVWHDAVPWEFIERLLVVHGDFKTLEEVITHAKKACDFHRDMAARFAEQYQAEKLLRRAAEEERDKLRLALKGATWQI